MYLSTDRKIAILLAVFAVIYLILSYQLPKFPYAIVDSDVLPKGLGFLLLVLSIILFIQNNTGSGSLKNQRNGKEVKVLLLIFLFVFLYILWLEWLGFVIVTIFFLIGTTRLLGYRKWGLNILVSVLFTLGLYYAFNYLLRSNLPQGFLPF